MIVASLAVVSIQLFVRKKTVPGEESLIHDYTWTLEYDEKDNLVHREMKMDYSGSIIMEMDYEYDEERNRIMRRGSETYTEFNSGYYDEFVYENDRLIAKTGKDGAYARPLIQQKDGTICEKSDENEKIYTLNEQGKVIKIQIKYVDEEELYDGICCEYYDEDRVKSLSYFENKFVYEYDKKGRISKIIRTINENDNIYRYYPQSGNRIEVQFIYHWNGDYTAYAYDEEYGLIGKYEYICDKKGNVTEIEIYTGENFYEWPPSEELFFFSYPGEELEWDLLEY